MNKQIKLNFERKDTVKKFQRMLCTGVMLGLMACTASAGAAASSDVTIVDTKLDKVITAQQMVDSFTPYNAIFFGEFHDQDVLQSVEYDVLKKLYKKYGSRLVLSMEMFEKDNQEKLNNYLAGKITEDEFIKTSRPWPRYLTDYKPMIEFAKAHKIPVIASNIPRFLAATLAKQGTVENIEPRYRQYLPDKTYAPEGAYKEKFAGYMTRGGEVMKISQEKLNQVFAAQCIKDDKMAESIFYYLDANPDSVIFHVNGCFHSDGHLGTVKKLENLNPELAVAVISPKDMPADKDYMKNYAKDKNDGEYLIYFERVNKEVESK